LISPEPMSLLVCQYFERARSCTEGMDRIDCGYG
jgi:hypothetical protein